MSWIDLEWRWSRESSWSLTIEQDSKFSSALPLCLLQFSPRIHVTVACGEAQQQWRAGKCWLCDLLGIIKTNYSHTNIILVTWERLSKSCRFGDIVLIFIFQLYFPLGSSPIETILHFQLQEPRAHLFIKLLCFSKFPTQFLKASLFLKYLLVISFSAAVALLAHSKLMRGNAWEFDQDLNNWKCWKIIIWKFMSKSIITKVWALGFSVQFAIKKLFSFGQSGQLCLLWLALLHTNAFHFHIYLLFHINKHK